MVDVLEEYVDKICSVWVDDIVVWGEKPEILLFESGCWRCWIAC